MSAYTGDHLVEQPAIQLMQDALGWEVVNCYDEPPSPRLRRSGWRKEGVEPRLEMLNPGLPIEGVVGEEILNDGFWILNGRGR